MKFGKVEISSLQICFVVVIATIIFVADPADSHPHVVRRDTKNELCGDVRLYFNDTGKCYPTRRQGPCGELMLLEPSAEDKNIGECICDSIKRAPLLGNSHLSSTCPQRPKVFWQEESRCYYIYDQGPCEKGEWVVPHKHSPPSCERITCLEKYNAQFLDKDYASGLTRTMASARFIFPKGGKCHLAYTEGTDFCPAQEYAFFIEHDSFNLHCSQYLACAATYTPVTDCSDGSTPDLQGGCEPTTLFN